MKSEIMPYPSVFLCTCSLAYIVINKKQSSLRSKIDTLKFPLSFTAHNKFSSCVWSPGKKEGKRVEKVQTAFRHLHDFWPNIYPQDMHSCDVCPLYKLPPLPPPWRAALAWLSGIRKSISGTLREHNPNGISSWFYYLLVLGICTSYFRICICILCVCICCLTDLAECSDNRDFKIAQGRAEGRAKNDCIASFWDTL